MLFLPVFDDKGRLAVAVLWWGWCLAFGWKKGHSVLWCFSYSQQGAYVEPNFWSCLCPVESSWCVIPPPTSTWAAEQFQEMFLFLIFSPAVTSKHLMVFNLQEAVRNWPSSPWLWSFHHSQKLKHLLQLNGLGSLVLLLSQTSSLTFPLQDYLSFFPSVCSLDSSLSLYKPLHHEWSICAFPVFQSQKQPCRNQ